MNATLRRLLHATGMAAVALALLASVAAGSASLGIEPAGSFTATSEGRVTFQDRGGAFRVSCNMTLTGILGIGVNKEAARSLVEGPVAKVKTATLGSCTETLGGAAEGRFLLEAEEPYQLRYDSFLGTLPNITGVLLTTLGVKLELGSRSLGIRCLFEGEIGFLVRVEAGRMSRFTYLESVTRLISGSESCPREGAIRGTMRLATAQTITLQAGRIRPGVVTASPEPMRITRNQNEQFLMLTNSGGPQLLIRRVQPEEREGHVFTILENACLFGRWLLNGERCSVLVRKERVPAEGQIVIEYKFSGVVAAEKRVRYDAEL
ncbi:MAG TPA: hypothetical protein VE972_05785 [Conexibacter sp.]|nr:hypothetical protein [Conexibacter sp.]